MLKEVVSKEVATQEFEKMVDCFRSLKSRDWADEQNAEIKDIVISGLMYDYVFLDFPEVGCFMSYKLESPVMKGDEILISEVKLRTRVSKNQYSAAKDKAKKICKNKLDDLEEIEGMAISALMCNVEYEIFNEFSIADISRLSKLATLFLT